MESLILIVHVLLALGVIGLVLLQHGKGADMGASFGAGASQTVFGSRGAGNFLSRTTAILATAFFITSFVLAVYAKDKASQEGDVGMPSAPAMQQTAPQEGETVSAEDELPDLNESEQQQVPAEDTEMPELEE